MTKIVKNFSINIIRCRMFWKNCSLRQRLGISSMNYNLNSRSTLEQDISLTIITFTLGQEVSVIHNYNLIWKREFFFKKRELQ